MTPKEFAVRAARRAQSAWRRSAPLRPQPGPPFPLNCPFQNGFLDSVYVEPAGIIRLIGWCQGFVDLSQLPSVHLDGQRIPFFQHFRFSRPDVQTGLALEYLLPESLIRPASLLSIDIQGTPLKQFEAAFNFVTPHYRALLDTREVYRREHIYGSGPPNERIDPEVLEAARQLPGPVLDFGCGRGVLIAELHRLGVEAYGLELDSAIIRQSIPSALTQAITLYDGSFPSPFQTGRFRSVFCSEVLEHIPAYQSAIQDIARLATEKVIFTVPDSSAIPIGFRHGVVPWHLLECTHVNFFTQQSLEAALTPHFSKIEFGRAGLSHFNDSPYYVSLVATCLLT